jgi:hypothetical protein
MQKESSKVCTFEISVGVVFLVYALPNVSSPGSQPTGQSSPVWREWTTLRVSFTLRPTGRSWTIWARRIPSGSIMNVPLRAIPMSSRSTPYFWLISFVISERRGMWSSPRSFAQAWWE